MSYDMNCEGCGKPLTYYHKIILRKETVFLCVECFHLWVKVFNEHGLNELHGEEFRKKFEKLFKSFLKKRRQKIKVKLVFT